jgi:hypothetical protein
MEKLYDHVKIKQLEATNASMMARLEALEIKNPSLITQQNSTAITTVNGAVDQSVGKTINNNNNTAININISVFGSENLGRITKPQVFDILRGLGPVGDNVKTIAEKAIIQAAMLIFSDPSHPEDITCYLPNKKGEDAMIHGESGWEVQPVGLVISPMATKAIDALFAQQPAPDTETPANDVKWMMNECGNILRYIQQHEGDMTSAPPRGEMRSILIRNKDLLQRVLEKLPISGQKQRCPAITVPRAAEKKSVLASVVKSTEKPFTCCDAVDIFRKVKLPSSPTEIDKRCVAALITAANSSGIEGGRLMDKLIDAVDDDEHDSQDVNALSVLENNIIKAAYAIYNRTESEL